jgi:hypothetical protein
VKLVQSWQLRPRQRPLLLQVLLLLLVPWAWSGLQLLLLSVAAAIASTNGSTLLHNTTCCRSLTK